jgi:hypothetical protein
VLSYINPEQRVPQDHPLRSLRVMTDEALRELQPGFNKLYAKSGRPSIAPEKLLRAPIASAVLEKSSATGDKRSIGLGTDKSQQWSRNKKGTTLARGNDHRDECPKGDAEIST